MADVDAAIWHDIECGRYRADLALWRRLAARAGDPILDLGAGAGRVSLALARAGHRVWALDRDADLLAALARRAAAEHLDVRTLHADARHFEVSERFALALAPMQLIQLLDGPAERAELLVTARAHLRPGGILALALADALDALADDRSEPPRPDVAVHDGVRYVSQPLALRVHADAVIIERVRSRHGPTGDGSVTLDSVSLARLDGRRLIEEARAAGFSALRTLRVHATSEHVGGEVVRLRA